MHLPTRKTVLATVGCSLALPMAIYQLRLGLEHRFLPSVVVGLVLLCSLGLMAGLRWNEAVFVPVVKATGWFTAAVISVSVLAWSYAQNHGWCFYGGMLLLLLLLWRIRPRLRAHPIGLQFVNTLVLLLVLLPLTDRLTAPATWSEEELLRRKAYSYAVSGRNRALLAQWWAHFSEEWRSARRDITTSDPSRTLPFRLVPGSETEFFNGELRINPLGFRDEPFSSNKEEAYRIVALGESTTMGITLERGDQPWPKMLEAKLRERFGAHRPIQVINAGVAGYSLEHNLSRFEDDILPLDPDMIISYHGFNGFCLLEASLPPHLGKGPPRFRARPLHLLARAEYRLRMMRFLKRHLPEGHRATDRLEIGSHGLESPYADLYRGLIQICQEHGIRVVLGTFNLAVNGDSPPEVVGFYKQCFAAVHRLIFLNQVHTRMLEGLVLEYPDVTLARTENGLDGHYDQYIDLMHFTESGRARLAQHFYEAIEPILLSQLQPADAAAAKVE